MRQLFFLIFIIMLPTSAWANLWYVVDAQGQMHFSAHYQGQKWRLLMRSASGSEMPARFRIKRDTQTELLAKRINARQVTSANVEPVNNTASKPFAKLIAQSAKRYQLPYHLVRAVIEVESSYQHRAVSQAGAMGLMQLMPTTAKRFNLAHPFEPAANINAGCKYLKLLLDEFQSTPLALAAYNAGESAVRRYQGIPPYPETRHYVQKVMALLKS
ncbi:lytic transglycosylase domain-containing protein [Celerinatantimonas yamalensis]|uniref:Lytic transglycosylase domain-containing protein n=1 Tax=Celerinatantimonas yamalensis TaxID=559956 RepID=A0ABW9G3D0_9GAMM